MHGITNPCDEMKILPQDIVFYARFFLRSRFENGILYLEYVLRLYPVSAIIDRVISRPLAVHQKKKGALP
jgi:hypothetical protein